MKQYQLKKLFFTITLLISFSYMRGQDDFALRINAGGSEIDYDGETFGSDTYFDTGRTLERSETGLPGPYGTFRFAPSQRMGYDIPVPDGEYTVNLHFAELWFGATGGGLPGAGRRVFDVSIEGQLVEDDLDIFNEAGAEAMLVKTHNITVADGTLNIDFDSRDEVGGERHPVISAIEILGGAIQRPMIIKWQTDASHELGVNEGLGIDIGAISDSGDYTVDWGDGNITTGSSEHVYNTNGTYSISISGDIHGVRFGVGSGNRSGDEPKLISIEQWGDMVWTTARNAFLWCLNLDVNATDVPDLSQVTDISRMFEECRSLTGNDSFNEWDVSNVTDMGWTFRGAKLFNAPIGDWDVGNVINMESTFHDAQAFDQDISSWDFGNVSEIILPTMSVENFSTENYDLLLESLGGQQLQDNVRFDMGSSRYCFGEEARQSVIDGFGWTFIDGGQAADCSGESNFVLRINIGGSEINYNGETFGSDTYFDTGRTLDRPQTRLPEPYKTFRFSTSQVMGYDIPLPDGEYTVNLHFAELWFGATGGGLPGAGRRVFDVSMEGQLVEDDFDIFNEVGAEAMLVKTHNITVADGILNIDFDSRDEVGGERHPVINAIEILGKNSEPDLAVQGFVYYRSGGSAPDLAGSLNDDDKIYLTVDGGLSFAGLEAKVSEDVKSIRYELAGAGGNRTIVENTTTGLPLWALGDEIGLHTITATPFSEENEGGVQGNPFSITYEILDHCEAVSIETFDASCNLSNGYAILRDKANNQSSFSSDLDEIWVYDETLAAFKASNLAPGLYEVGYENYDCVITKYFVIEDDCPKPDVALRINAGGSEINYEGKTFAADTYFDTGRTLDRPQTGLPEPYKTFRFSTSQVMGYAIPVPDGEYTVNLYFAELWFGATGGGLPGAGRRVFDVNIENQLTEDNLDIFAEVGAEAMLVITHKVTVMDGVMNIEFDSRDVVGGERHPVINAIEVLSSNDSSSFNVWLEAECAIVGGNWTLISDDSRSNGQYLESPAELPAGSSFYDSDNFVSFDIVVPKAGIYNIHALIAGPSTEPSSEGFVRYTINGIPSVHGAGPISPDFGWLQLWNTVLFSGNSPIELMAGSNTIEITYGGKGISLDKIYVTDSDYIPTGFGQPDSSCNIIGKFSLSSKKDDNSIILYPNEASYFTILSFEKPTEVKQIYVFDLTGRLIQSYNPKDIKNGNDYAIDVSQYQQGTYILKMIDSTGENFEKLMVVKRK